MPPCYVPTSLAEEGRVLVEGLGGRWTGDGGVCRCPAHDDRRPSLSVRVGRTSLLLHCFAGCDAADVLRALRAAGRPLRAAPDIPRPLPGRPPDDSRFRRAAHLLWRDARPIEGTPAARYLEGRALCTASAELRYHSRTPFGPRPSTRFRPALIAAVRDEAGLVAVHRTFLDVRGDKSRTGPARYGLGRPGRGAVRLGSAQCRLGLAEGIETALSASRLFGMPCWATLGTERFAHISLPPCVRELVLFLDNDTGGRRAEALARQAFPALSIEALYPRRPGFDWNDVLRAALRRSASP